MKICKVFHFLVITELWANLAHLKVPWKKEMDLFEASSEKILPQLNSCASERAFSNSNDFLLDKKWYRLNEKPLDNFEFFENNFPVKLGTCLCNSFSMSKIKKNSF